MIRLIGIAALMAIAALGLVPAVALAHGGTTVSIKGDVRADGPIEIVGEDFGANDVVRIELRREGITPLELGRVPADADGNFTETLHVPATVPAGLYQLAADGEESATAEVTVLGPASGSAAAPQPAAGESVENNRPAAETAGLAVFAAVLAIAALGALWASRTHARPAVSGDQGRTN